MKTAYEHNKEQIQKVVPTMAYRGGDVATWQAAAREKLAQLVGLDKFEKVDLDVIIEYKREEDGFTDVRFTYQSEAGYRVPCHM